MYSIYLWSLILQDLIIGVHLQKLRSKMWCLVFETQCMWHLSHMICFDVVSSHSSIVALMYSQIGGVQLILLILKSLLVSCHCHITIKFVGGRQSKNNLWQRFFATVVLASLIEFCVKPGQRVVQNIGQFSQRWFMYVFSQVIAYTLGCLPITICIFYFIYGLATIGSGHLGWRTPIGHAVRML